MQSNIYLHSITLIAKLLFVSINLNYLVNNSSILSFWSVKYPYVKVRLFLFQDEFQPGEETVSNELANRMSLFYAQATPMLKALSDITDKFVTTVCILLFLMLFSIKFYIQTCHITPFNPYFLTKFRVR